MLVVIPCFGEEVAPRFESALRFRLWQIMEKTVMQYSELEFDKPPDGLARLRLVERIGGDVLICNGIANVTRKMIKAKGCKVIQSVVGPASDALYGYLAEKIIDIGQESPLHPGAGQPNLMDLTEWTFELLLKLGWTVTREKRPEIFPVDFTAQRVCDVCGKAIRIALCCGAHAYRVDEEIREFHRVTACGYHGRFYIHQHLPGVAGICRDFGIILIDPETFSRLQFESGSEQLSALFRGPIPGHEKLALKPTPISRDRGVL